MREFTDARGFDTPDELWLLQHPPVFTQGQAGRAEHILNPGAIPVIPSDRGGQATYHGPGQWIAYLLLDLRRRRINVRELVDMIEHSVVGTLAALGIQAAPRRDAPGVYVDGAKIAALGLRIRRGCSYHGVALNTDMDLEPFSRINPCGCPNLPVTDIPRCLPNAPLNPAAIGERLLAELEKHLLRQNASCTGAHPPRPV